jgi:hypothetical protein
MTDMLEEDGPLFPVTEMEYGEGIIFTVSPDDESEETLEMCQRIEALLERCGFRSNGLFVMDGSKRSAHGNAYFTGFGRTKRIVFFDTLLSRL